jgi:hypothetical protein
MAKYTMKMAVNGHVDVEVESDSVAEAFKRAYGAVADVDLNTMQWDEVRLVSCYDADGNLLWGNYNG